MRIAADSKTMSLDLAISVNTCKDVVGVQFDEYMWFDLSSAVTPLPTQVGQGLAQTYPFGA